MSLRRRKVRRNGQRERDANSESSVAVKTITVDRIESNISTSLTLSTLIVGVAMSMMLATSRDDMELFHDSSEDATTSARE